MSKNLLISLIGSILLFSTAFSQPKTDHCGTTREMEKYYESNPSALQEFFKSEKEAQDFIENKMYKAANKYIIPVVFHVFGTTFNSGSTVDDALIIDALQKLNNDFQGLTADWATVAAEFQSIKKAFDITFALAELDPDGNPTTGITYNPVKEGFGNGSGYNSQIQSYAWDNYKYMNIYIMRDLYDDNVHNNSGVSWYPDTWMSNNNLARVVYNGSYLSTNTSENFRSVLTHEFGHWLNLKHPFDGGCTEPNDNVSDTPQTLCNSGTCNTSNETCLGAGVPNGENFMDYTECYKMFTKGQVDRMIAALETHAARNTLWQESNLLVTVPSLAGPIIIPNKTAFQENTINDGSYNDTIILELHKDNFIISGGTLTEGTHYNLLNLPTGLSLEIKTSLDTAAIAVLTGQTVDHSTDITDLTITFLDAAFLSGKASLVSDNPAIFTLDYINPEISTSTNEFAEKSTGMGAINNVIILTITDASLSQIGGEFTEDTHYQISNVPDGLTAILDVRSTSTIWFSLTGNATNHTDGDDISDLTLTFLDEAFSGIPVANISGTTNIYSVNFGTTTGLNDNNINDNFVIQPNPNNGSFTIKPGSSIKGDATISIYNMAGQTVWSQQINLNDDELQIQLENPSSGIYLIQIVTDSGIFRKKIRIE